MAGHGACRKLGCNCKSYSKSILTPGLCKSCNHVKDSHNKFIQDDDDDEEEYQLPDNQYNNGINNNINITTTTTTDYSSDENDIKFENNKNKKKIKISSSSTMNDNYPQKLLKKKPQNAINHTESMWKNKYLQSQKEVEKWQTKYNDLYIKYKELLSQKQSESSSSQQQQQDLLSFTINDDNNNNNNNNNNDNDPMAQWTTFN